MIEARGISKYYGSKAILEDVDLFIGRGDRIGLVGLNGAGKTSLFRILLGQESRDEGRVTRPKQIQIGYLSQEVYLKARQGATVLDECVSGVRGIGELVQEKEQLQARLMGPEGTDTEELARRLGEVQDALAHAGYHSIEAQARTVLTGLGFDPKDIERPLATLSGGFLMRVQIAKLLLSEPDLLLLDEPTNHLDLESLVFLENYITGYKGAFCVATHDRAFLNRAVDRIWELERGKITVYTGGYDSYRKQKAEAVRHQQKQYEEQQAKIRAAQEFIARNRVRKDRARQVQARIRYLDSMELVEKPVFQRPVNFQFPQPPKGPDKVLTLKGITKAFGEKVVVNGVDLTLTRGERVVLVGRNGAGKTTLLRIIADVMAPDSGSRQLGTGVEIGYYAQDQLEVLDPKSTPYREVLNIADPDTAPRVRGLLGAFRFSSEDIDKKVMVLSGGEKARVALCRLLIRRPGLLVMDEPTNHLDIPSMEVLEKALKDFTGTIIMVSHDRRFIDAVATRVVEVDFGGLESYPGKYTYFLSKKRGEAQPRQKQTRTSGERLDRKERRKREAELRNRRYRVIAPLKERVQALEARIEKVEARIEELNLLMSVPELYEDPEKARELAGQHAEASKLLDDLLIEWERANRELQKALDEFEA